MWRMRERDKERERERDRERIHIERGMKINRYRKRKNCIFIEDLRKQNKCDDVEVDVCVIGANGERNVEYESWEERKTYVKFVLDLIECYRETTFQRYSHDLRLREMSGMQNDGNSFHLV